LEAGVDDFTVPPAQNPDMFLKLQNILPPASNVLLRRYGYRFFNPALDNGTTISSDELTGSGPMLPQPYYRALITTQNQGVALGNSHTFTVIPNGASGWPFNTPVALGFEILDSNGHLQRCIVAGTTNSSGAPTWGLTPGSITTETTGVTWLNVFYSINIGDTIIVSLQQAANGVATITGIVDSLGDTWSPLFSPQSIVVFGNTITQSGWSTIATQNVAVGGSFTITPSWTGATNLSWSVSVFSNVGSVVGSAANTGLSSSTWSSGSLGVVKNTVALSFEVAQFSAGVAAPFTVVNNPNVGIQLPQNVAFDIITTSGSLADSWTQGGSGPFASTLVLLV
jgi:hypothetical protein